MEDLEAPDRQQLEEIRQFLMAHDIIEVPEPYYQLIEELMPELLYKVKPPVRRLH